MLRFVLLLFTMVILQIGRICSQEANSVYEGKHFFVPFMKNEVDLLRYSKYLTQKIFIYTSEANEVSIYDAKQGLRIKKLAKDEEWIIETFEDVSEIKSKVPITVTALSSHSNSSDSYSILPVSNWGKKYVITSMPNDRYYADGNPRSVVIRPGEFCVVASENNTRVNITPRAITDKKQQENQTFYVSLNKGERYLVMSHPALGYGRGDLTGSLVEADKPIVVLSGHVRSSVPTSNMKNMDSKDHLAEMPLPVSAWGKTYYSVPFEISNVNKGDLFKITNIEPETYVVATGQNFRKEFALTEPGSFVSIDRVDVPVVWTSNKPIQIAQMMSHLNDGVFNKSYDPCMIFLPPEKRFVQSIFYATPIHQTFLGKNFKEHKITLILSKYAMSSLRIDGVLMKTMPGVQFHNFDYTDLYYVTTLVDEGTHKITTKLGGFNGISYGYGYADSYGMILGTSFKNPAFKDTVKPIVDLTALCGRISGTIRDSVGGSGMQWVGIVKSETYNYDYKIEGLETGEEIIKISASPINKKKDAQIWIEYSDKNGNGGVYKHKYKGMKVLYDKNVLNYGKVIASGQKTLDFEIKNVSDTSIYLQQIVIPFEDRLTFTTSRPLPAEIKPDSMIVVSVVFNPNSNIKSLFENIELLFACDIKDVLIATGSVVVPELEGVDFNFGLHLVESVVKNPNRVLLKNTGTSAVNIEAMVISKASSAFTIDTAGRFPVVLQPKQTLLFPVTFTALSENKFELTGHFKNVLNISNSFTLRGEGGIPKISGIKCDWGRRRVGTVNDTSFNISNIGTYPATLKFNSFVEKSIDDDNVNYISATDRTIGINKQINFAFSYKPKNIGDYKVISNMKSNWYKHDEILFELEGTATLPVISTLDLDMGIIRLPHTVEKDTVLIFSKGNEELTIDNITVVSGDINQFEIEYRDYDNIIIAENSGQKLKIKYRPISVGKHQLRLKVRHDANPNYVRSDEYITINAEALPATQLLPEVDFQIPNNLNSCEKYTLNIILKSNNDIGNVDISFTDIGYEFDPNIVFDQWNMKPIEPVVIAPQQQKEYSIDFIMKDRKSTELTLTYKVDGFDFEKKIKIDSKLNPATIDEIATLHGEVGSYPTLQLSGKLTANIEYPAVFSINLEVDPSSLYFYKQNIDLNIVDASGTRTYPLELSRENSRIVMKSAPIELSFKKEMSWNVSMKYRLLLNQDLDTKGIVNIDFGECFNTIQKEFKGQIKKVCAHDLMALKVITDMPLLNIKSNIVTDIVKLDVFCPDNGYVESSIINLLGQKTPINTKKYCEKGFHVVDLEINTLQCGTYILYLRYKEYGKKIIFIKSK